MQVVVLNRTGGADTLATWNAEGLTYKHGLDTVRFDAAGARLTPSPPVRKLTARATCALVRHGPSVPEHDVRFGGLELVARTLEDVTKKWRKKELPRRFDFSAGLAADGSAVFEAMLAHPLFGRVEHLTLADVRGDLVAPVVRAIDAGRLAHLRSLSLQRVAPEVVAHAFERLTTLSALLVQSVEVSDEAFATMLETNALRALVDLDLSNQYRLGNQTARRLAEGVLPQLRALSLSYVSVGDEGLRALVEGPAMARLARFSYLNAQCGTALGLDVPLTNRVRGVLEGLMTRPEPAFVQVTLELEEAATLPAGDVRVAARGVPSAAAFASIWAALELDATHLEEALSLVQAWPREVRVAPPYAINHLVSGRASAGLLRLATGLRLFDLVLDEATNTPLAGEASEAQVSRLEAWLATLTDEGHALEVLDCSPGAWLEKFPVTDEDLGATRYPLKAASWAALFAKLPGLRVLNVSRGVVSFDPTRHADYERRAAFPQGMTYELDLGAALAAAPFREGLRELCAQGLTANQLTLPPLPALEVLDLSARALRRTVSTHAPQLPRLQTLVLGRDSLIDYALEKGAPDEWLEHDYGIGSTEGFEALLLDDAGVTSIRKAWPALALLQLGGEVRHKRVARRKKSPEVRDADDAAGRRWLAWSAVA